MIRPTVPYKVHTDADDLFDGQEVKGWNVTIYTVSGAKYNEYGNVTLIEPTFGSTYYTGADRSLECGQ